MKRETYYPFLNEHSRFTLFFSSVEFDIRKRKSK